MERMYRYIKEISPLWKLQGEFVIIFLFGTTQKNATAQRNLKNFVAQRKF